MGNDLGSVEIRTGLDFSGVRADLAAMRVLMMRNIQTMSDGFDKMGSSAKRAGTAGATAGKSIQKSFSESIKSALSMERVISRLAFIGTVGMVYSLGRAFKQAFGEGVTSAREFEKALAHVNTVLDDSAKHYMPAFKAGIESMSIVYAKSVNELSKSLYDIISARIPPEHALHVLNQVTTLAVANQADMKDVTTAVVGIMNAYNYSANEAVIVTDKLQATVKYGRMELSDIAGTLGRVASAAGAMGVALDDVLGSLATMTRQGMNARESVTALRRMILKFSEDAYFSAKIQKEGLLSVIPIMELMTNKQKIMYAGGIRGFNAMIIAMKNYAAQGRDVLAIANSEGEALKALGIEINTATHRLESAKQRWNAIWREGSGGFVEWSGILLEAASRASAVGFKLVNIANILNNITPAILNKWFELFDMPISDSFGNSIKWSVKNIKELEKSIKDGNFEDLFDELNKGMSNVDPQQGGVMWAGDLGYEKVNDALAKQKEDLTTVLKLQKLKYDNAVLKGKGEAEALADLTATWQKYIDVLKSISGLGGDFPDFLEDFITEENAMLKFIASLTKAEKEITLDDKIKDINSSLRENISILDLQRQLGKDVNDETIKAYDDAIKKIRSLGLARDEYIIQRLELERDLLLQGSKAQAIPDTSEYDAWLENIMKFATDVKVHWAKHANTLKGISGITSDNIIENWKSIYEAIKKESPNLAELFKEMVEEITEAFDWMGEITNAFVSGVSSGFSSMIRDVLDGANMMRKKWGEYFKEMANTFIYELSRMLVEWLAFKAITGILGLITGGATGVAQGASQLGGGFAPPTPSIKGISAGGSLAGGSASTINNFNPSFNPNINVGATFSQRDMAFIYKTGKSYYGKTSL